MKPLALTIGGALVVMAGALPARGDEGLSGGDPASGRVLALRACTPCHIVSPDQPSASGLAIAPAFKAIANAPAMTATALHAFLATPHPTMPNFILSPQESGDIVAYILSLKNRP